MDVSLDNITQRRRLQRSSSFDTTRFQQYDNTGNSSSYLDSTMKSLHNTSSMEDCSVTELKTELQQMTTKLAWANESIKNLKLENSKLQTELKKCQEDLNAVKQKVNEQTIFNSPLLKRKKLNTYVCKEPIRINVDKSESNLTKVEEGTTLSHQKKNNMEEKQQRTQTQYELTTSRTVEKKKKKILILGDEQAKGLNKLLCKYWDDYIVSSVIKPGAECHSILNTKLQNDLDKDDILILLIGANDKMPTKLFCELSVFLKKYQSLNVFILETLYNPCLNEQMLNSQIRLLCNQHDNCNFIPLAKPKIKYNNKKSDLTDLCYSIKQKIDTLNYKGKLTAKIEELKSKRLLNNKKTSYENKKGTIPYYFKNIQSTKPIIQSIQNNNLLNNTTNDNDGTKLSPKKGTIPYYFKKMNIQNKFFRNP